MSFLPAILGLCVVLVLHEFGHYLAAVATGMKVDRFSVFGIGRPIARLGTFRGTEFVIGAIPFGAYVQIHGMDPRTPDDPPAVPGDPPRFRDRPAWARFVVLVGGPLANYVAAMALFIGAFALEGKTGPIEAITVQSFAEASPAAAAGLEVGDELTRIADVVVDPTQGPGAVATIAGAHRGRSVPVVVRRGEEVRTFEVAIPQEGRALGVMLGTRAPRIPVGPSEAIGLGSVRPFEITIAQLGFLYQWIAGHVDGQLQGPVGMVKGIAQSVEWGFGALLAQLGLISTALGMFNLMPLPALDGGRIVFVALSSVIRSDKSDRLEEIVHTVGMLLLLSLIAFITFRELIG